MSGNGRDRGNGRHHIESVVLQRCIPTERRATEVVESQDEELLAGLEESLLGDSWSTFINPFEELFFVDLRYEDGTVVPVTVVHGTCIVGGLARTAPACVWERLTALDSGVLSTDSDQEELQPVGVNDVGGHVLAR